MRRPAGLRSDKLPGQHTLKFRIAGAIDLAHAACANRSDNLESAETNAGR